MPIEVFLSSTAKDLAVFRQKTADAINRLDGYHCVQMENFGARQDSAVQFLPDLVCRSRLIVFLLGPTYGSRPPRSEKSYTELEYDTAVATDRPCLVFVTSDKFAIPQHLLLAVPPDEFEKARQFRARVRNRHIWQEFTTPDELAALVVEAIQNWERQGQNEKGTIARDRYLDYLIALNTYVIPRGIFQTRRSISLKLSETYISLRAQPEKDTIQADKVAQQWVRAWLGDAGSIITQEKSELFEGFDDSEDFSEEGRELSRWTKMS